MSLLLLHVYLLNVHVNLSYIHVYLGTYYTYIYVYSTCIYTCIYYASRVLPVTKRVYARVFLIVFSGWGRWTVHLRVMETPISSTRVDPTFGGAINIQHVVNI